MHFRIFFFHKFLHFWELIFFALVLKNMYCLHLTMIINALELFWMGWQKRDFFLKGNIYPSPLNKNKTKTIPSFFSFPWVNIRWYSMLGNAAGIYLENRGLQRKKKNPTWYNESSRDAVEFNQRSVLLPYPTRLAKAKTPRKKKYTASRRLMYSLEKICK